jgi:hypothetical protein
MIRIIPATTPSSDRGTSRQVTRLSLRDDYGKRAVIDVLYKWGPKTNYPGDERTTSFIFLLEDGAWKFG